jgi:hypothetical protein
MTPDDTFKSQMQEAIAGLEWQLEHLGAKNQRRAVVALATISTLISIVQEQHGRLQYIGEVSRAPIQLEDNPDSEGTGAQVGPSPQETPEWPSEVGLSDESEGVLG